MAVWPHGPHGPHGQLSRPHQMEREIEILILLLDMFFRVMTKPDVFGSVSNSKHEKSIPKLFPHNGTFLKIVYCVEEYLPE